MNHHSKTPHPLPYALSGAGGDGGLVLVCEHASNVVPAHYARLSQDTALLQTHVAWDPGAMVVARHVSALTGSPLVAGTISRLVYDCNRPPEAPDAVPTHSERFEIAGNGGLSPAHRLQRVRAVHDPFHASVAGLLDTCAKDVALVTIHSFTPVYNGQRRQVEIGVLHDSDARLADAMLACAARHTPRIVARNVPYGPEDGVTYTLRRHGVSRGLANVMIEVRNDLLTREADCRDVATMLAGWLTEAIQSLQKTGPHNA